MEPMVCDICDHRMVYIEGSLPHCSYCFFTRLCQCGKAITQDHTCFYLKLAEYGMTYDDLEN